ncbi:MAG: hypothetical protein WC508_05635, partial [Patescibacteria group bacterium]
MKALSSIWTKYHWFSLIILAIIIFIVTFFGHLMPVLVKGYSPAVETDNLILARNLHFTGQRVIESDLNVYLSTEVLKEKGGLQAGTQNILTPLIYSQLFDIFGWQPNLPLYVSLACWSAVILLLFFLSLRLFNLTVALLTVGTLTLIPAFWWGSITLGFYEFAVLFFTLGLFFYFYPKKNKNFSLVLASIFFALAVLSRNAFLISILLIFVFEFFKQRSFKRLACLVVPLVIIVGGVFLTDFKTGSNVYFSSDQTKTFGYYTHVFPDPYTYHFDKENYLAKIKAAASGDIAGKIIDMGGYQGKALFVKYLELFANSSKYYIVQCFRPTILGGILVLSLLFFGFYHLKKSNKDLLQLFIFWPVVLFLALVVLKTSNSDHFMELVPIISIVSALGIYYLLNLVINSESSKNKKIFFGAILVIGILGNLLAIDKILFGREYGGQNVIVNTQPLIWLS